MLLARSIKAIGESAKHDAPEKIQLKLLELQGSLVVSYFNPVSSKYREDILPLLLKRVLPLTSHTNLQLRVQTSTFIAWLSSVVAAICPQTLFGAYAALDANNIAGLEPASLASVFTSWASSLRSCAPIERAEQIEKCYSLLLKSQPELLTRVAPEMWSLVRDGLSVRGVKEIVQKLMGSPLADPIVILCEKEPDMLFEVVVKEAPLQLLKEFIPKWGKIHEIRFDVFGNRLVEYLQSSDSGAISSTLEIVVLIMTTMGKAPCGDDCEIWSRVFGAIETVWGSGTLSQQAKIIGVLMAAYDLGIIELDALRRFLVFDLERPVIISVPVIRVGAVFVAKTGRIPRGMLDFLIYVARDRDPLLYLACLNCLEMCFHEMYVAAPMKTKVLLDLCLHPLPTYFVEKVAVLNMLIAFDWNVFPSSELPTSIVDIIFGFLREPHASIMSPIVKLMHATGTILPLHKLDWMESASSYVRLLHELDPLFVVELLDNHLITPAAFPDVVNLLARIAASLSVDIQQKLFARSVTILAAAVEVLKVNVDGLAGLKKLRDKSWYEYGHTMGKLYDVLNDDIQTTFFGKMIEASLALTEVTIQSVEIKPRPATALVSIASVFGCVFTPVCCRIVDQVKSNDSEVVAEISKFFDRPFPFDHSVDVVLAALICLVDPEERKKVDRYVKVALNKSRDVIKICEFDDSDFHCTFLALVSEPDRQEYVKKCVSLIPFEQWVIEEEDFEFISGLSEINVDNVNDLDAIHRTVVAKYPNVFIVADTVVIAEQDPFLYTVPDVFSLGVEVVDEVDEDDEQVKTAAEAPAVPFAPYRREASKADLFGFLWYSTRKVLTTDEWRLIEEYAIAINEMKFSTAFLAYGRRHGLSVDTNRWSSLIRIDRNDQYSVIAFCLYCYSLQKKWSEVTESEVQAVEAGVRELGFQETSPEYIAHMHRSAMGSQRMVLDAAIAIDTTRFDEFPLLKYMFMSKEDVMSQLDQIFEVLSASDGQQYACEAAVIFSRFMFPAVRQSLLEQIDIPPNVQELEHYMHSWIDVTSIVEISLDEAIAKKIAMFFVKSRSCDSFIWTVLFQIKFPEFLYSEIMECVRNNMKYRSAYVRVDGYDFFLLGRNSPFVLNYSRGVKTPSYTRQIVSFLLSERRPNIPSSEKQDLLREYPGVMFALLPRGFETIRPAIMDVAFPVPEECVLAVQPAHQNDVVSAKAVFSASPVMARHVLDLLMQTDDGNLCKYFNTGSADAVLLELSEVIMGNILREQHYMKDTIEMVRYIIQTPRLVPLFLVLMQGDTANSVAFPNAFVMFHMMGKHAAQSHDEYIQSQWTFRKDSIVERAEKPERAEVLLSSDITASLERIYDV